MFSSFFLFFLLLLQTLQSDRSVVVSAPTGSGKTTVLDLALVRMLLAGGWNPAIGDFVSGKRTAVYMAPTKALCDERYQDWKRRFEPLVRRTETNHTRSSLETIKKLIHNRANSGAI